MKHILIIFVIAMCGFRSIGQTVTWTGGSSTDWSTAGNWSPATVPGPCNQVVVPTVASNNYPSLTSDVYIRNISFTGGDWMSNQYSLKFIEGAKGLEPIAFVNNTSTVSIDGINYNMHSAGKPYSINRSISTCAPIYRFEIHTDDRWATDITRNNTQNGKIKERTEFNQANQGIDFTSGNKTVWISYSIYIEPGGDIVYTNPNNSYSCYLGQWHHSGRDGGPPWAFKLLRQDELILETRAFNDTLSNGQLRAVNRDTAIVSRGQWHNFVMKTVHSKLGTGSFEWWIDGDQVSNIQNISIGYNEDTIGYWKFGIYRTPLHGSDTTIVAVRYANMEVNTVSNALESRILAPLSLD